SKESKETIRDSFQEQYSGANQGKPVVLDQSATVEAMPTIDAKTAEYLNNVDWTRAQVSKVFGIPDNYLNGQGDQQSSLDQSTSMFISSFNRYIKPFVSELEQKFKVPVKADLDPIVDPTGSKYANMIAKFASGKAPVLSGEQVIALLQRKGVIDDDFEK
ncbi:phage portal protein, partial [Pediococcus acidilactici]